MKKKKDKPIPDATVYLTKWGERVRIAKTKQWSGHPGETDWMKEIREESNKRMVVIRISDGYELWGYKIEDLKPI